jgi:phosphoserine phosphatase RsbU/P
MRRPFSIRVVLALALTAPVVAIAAVLVILNSITAHRIAENLGEQLLIRAGDVVQRDMSKYLSSAVRISDLYARRIENKILPTNGLAAWERPMLDDLVTTPDVASICLGNAQGDATWLLRNKGRLEVGRADGSRENFAQEFVVDPSTGIADTANPIRTYQYDPRVRPWYQVALRSAEPTWTPIYFWFGSSGDDLETGSGYTRPIKSLDRKEVVGVLVVDVTLGVLSGFLKRLPLAEHGYIFVIDEQNQLVAASHGNVNSADGQRLALAEHDHPAARAVAGLLSSQGVKDDGSRLATQRIRINDEPARLRLRTFNHAPGINWSIATVVPEHVFLSDAKAVERQGIVMGILATLMALALGFFVSRMIARPVLRIREHAQRIGSGDFETRLRLRAVRELDELCRDLNHMARDLKEREELRQSLVLANEVQQSLLPQAPPRIRGLDIAGQSRYCETTGGDYYDFIDVAELPMDRTMVAVGDVMGHGIASALLMTTARAALRATALKEGSLGVLLSRVNEVLARDSRHGRFMTMALAVVDPEHGTMRWANAGHDEPIVYSPVRGEFRKLDGGDLPLGVVQNVAYQEYCVTEVEPGSIIVIGTDGIWEAPSPEGERFGKARLLELIRNSSGETAADISKAINQALVTFCGKDCFPDDVTFVVVKLWLAN